MDFKKPKFLGKKIIGFCTISLVLLGCTEQLADKDIWFWAKVAFGVYCFYVIAKFITWLGGGRSGGFGCGGGASCGGGCGGGD